MLNLAKMILVLGWDLNPQTFIGPVVVGLTPRILMDSP